MLLKKIKEFIINVMEEWKVPGLSICILKNNTLFLKDGFGYSNLENKSIVSSNTLFRIGSITKSFTATAIGILVDRKMLSWDDPIRKYIPDFRIQGRDISKYITIRDLLSHQTQIPNYDNILFTNEIKTRKNLLNLLKYLPPNQEPKTGFQYNNFMYVVLGYLIEKLTDGSWEQFITDNILIPLKMKNTYFSREDAYRTGSLSTPYKEQSGILSPFPIDGDDISFMNPAGGLISCINDLYNWILLNLNEGKINNKEIISQSSIHEIHTPQVTFSTSKLPKEFSCECYAMGWRVLSYKGKTLIRHGGHVKGYSAEISFMPSENIGIAILCNRANVPVGQIISMYIYDILLGQGITNWDERFKKMYKDKEEKERRLIENRYRERKSKTTPTHPLSAFVGTYSNDCYGSVRIEEKKGNLVIKIKNDYFQLKHFHYNVFEFFDNLERRFEINFITDFKRVPSILLMKFKIDSEPVVFEREEMNIIKH